MTSNILAAVGWGCHGGTPFDLNIIVSRSRFPFLTTRECWFGGQGGVLICYLSYLVVLTGGNVLKSRFDRIAIEGGFPTKIANGR